MSTTPIKTPDSYFGWDTTPGAAKERVDGSIAYQIGVPRPRAGAPLASVAGTGSVGAAKATGKVKVSLTPVTGGWVPATVRSAGIARVSLKQLTGTSLVSPVRAQSMAHKATAYLTAVAGTGNVSPVKGAGLPHAATAFLQAVSGASFTAPLRAGATRAVAFVLPVEGTGLVPSVRASATVVPARAFIQAVDGGAIASPITASAAVRGAYGFLAGVQGTGSVASVQPHGAQFAQRAIPAASGTGTVAALKAAGRGATKLAAVQGTSTAAAVLAKFGLKAQTSIAGVGGSGTAASLKAVGNVRARIVATGGSFSVGQAGAFTAQGVTAYAVRQNTYGFNPLDADTTSTLRPYGFWQSSYVANDHGAFVYDPYPPASPHGLWTAGPTDVNGIIDIQSGLAQAFPAGQVAHSLWRSATGSAFSSVLGSDPGNRVPCYQVAEPGISVKLAPDQSLVFPNSVYIYPEVQVSPGVDIGYVKSTSNSVIKAGAHWLLHVFGDDALGWNRDFTQVTDVRYFSGSTYAVKAAPYRIISSSHVWVYVPSYNAVGGEFLPVDGLGREMTSNLNVRFTFASSPPLTFIDNFEISLPVGRTVGLEPSVGTGSTGIVRPRAKAVRGLNAASATGSAPAVHGFWRPAPLLASQNTYVASGYGTVNPPPYTVAVNTNPVTVTVSGGTAPYTYSWAHISGDFIDPTGSTSPFTFSAGLPAGTALSAVYQLTVHSNDGQSVVLPITTVDVQAD